MEKVLLFFVFPFLVAGQVFTSLRVQNIYVRDSDLDQKSMTFTCTLRNITLNGTLTWDIPPDLSNRSNIIRDRNGYRYTLTISPLHAGDRRNICCTYTAENDEVMSSCSFLNLTVLPAFRNVSNPAVINRDLHLGIAGRIDIPAYLGNPPTGVTCMKDGYILDNHHKRGTELVFDTVQSSHAGTINCSLDLPYPTDELPNPRFLIINLRVKSTADDIHLSTTEGATETLACQVDGDDPHITWRVRSGLGGSMELTNGSLNGRVLITADGRELQLADIRKVDFNRKFLCTSRTDTQVTVQRTILFYQETFKVCVSGEYNTKITTKVMEETLASFLDEDCRDKCLVNIAEISFNRERDGVYEVSGTVTSKGQVVRWLNDTLSSRNKYITQGLTIMLECTDQPTSTSPVSLTAPEMVAISVVGIVVIGISAVFFALLLYLAMKFRGRRSNQIDIESQSHPSSQNSGSTT